MTETLQRPARPSASGDDGAGAARHPLVAGSLAALWVTAAGLALVGLPVLLAWATDARAGAGAADALRTVGHVWVLAHGASLDVPGGVLALTPLGLLALPVLLLRRAGTVLGRTQRVGGLRAAAGAVGAVALPYAVLLGVVAELSATAQVVPGPLEALLAGLVVALVGGGLGVVRGAGLGPAVSARLPALVRRQLLAATGALGVLGAGAALLVGVSLAAHVDRANELTGATSPGAVGGAALLLVGLSLVPNAVAWGASWLVGPGFAVGVGTQVGPFAHELGPVPALPLLAALPGSGVPGRWGLLALLVPLAAGVVAGALVRRRLPAAGALRTAGEAAASGAVAGVLLAGLAQVSGGAAGGGRLTVVGPSAWEVGAVFAAEVAAAAVVAALVLRRRAG